MRKTEEIEKLKERYMDAYMDYLEAQNTEEKLFNSHYDSTQATLRAKERMTEATYYLRKALDG